MLHTAITAEAGITEANDRIYLVEPTPAWSSRADYPFTLRMWGSGGWTVCNGHAHHFTTEAAAHDAGRAWVETGRN